MEHPRNNSVQVIHEIRLNNSSIYFLYRSKANCKIVTVYTAWLRENLGLVLMGETMLSKSLIQFTVEGWAVFPPCCLAWGQTMVEVMKIMATSFKRSYAGTATLSAPDPAQATANHASARLLVTHRQVWVSLLWGHCSWVLVHTRFCLYPPRVCFPSPV